MGTCCEVGHLCSWQGQCVPPGVANEAGGYVGRGWGGGLEGGWGHGGGGYPHRPLVEVNNVQNVQQEMEQEVRVGQPHKGAAATH